MAGDSEIDVNTLSSTLEPPLLTITKWFPEWSAKKGIVNGGEAICNQPPDQKLMLNATTPLGHGNLLYMVLTYTMPKMHYNLLKVDEHIAVSPAYPEMYGRIIAKKRELEGFIKGGRPPPKRSRITSSSSTTRGSTGRYWTISRRARRTSTSCGPSS